MQLYVYFFIALEDALDPEDINKVASAVLAIKLPKSPDDIKKMIAEIQKKMGDFTQFNKDLKDLEEKAKLAKDLKNKADEILWVVSSFIHETTKIFLFSQKLYLLCFRDKTKNIDVSDIEKDLKDTSKLHDKIKPKIEQTENNIDAAKDIIDKVIITFIFYYYLIWCFL